MTSRIIRRVVYWILLAALVFGAIMLQVTASHHDMNRLGDSFVYLRTMQAALLLLLLWSAIFVRSEPVLIRFAIGFIVLSFFSAFWIYKL
jgi:hypothetical protein